MKYKLNCYDEQAKSLADIVLKFLPRKNDRILLDSSEIGRCMGTVSHVVIDTTDGKMFGTTFEIYLKDIQNDL